MADDFISSLSGGAGAGGGGNTADQLRNQVLSQLVLVLQAAFPQASAAITSTASSGAETLPANPKAFLTITVSGTAYKIPLYGV